MINILNTVKNIYKEHLGIGNITKDIENNINGIQKDMEELIKIEKHCPIRGRCLKTMIQQIIT